MQSRQIFISKSDKLTTMNKENVKYSNLLMFTLAIWFCANLLSQSVFIAINGLPYDAVSMLKSLGPIYYFILVGELVLWIVAGGWVVKKFMRLVNSKPVVTQVESSVY